MFGNLEICPCGNATVSKSSLPGSHVFVHYEKDLFVSYLPSILHLITKCVLLSAATAPAHKRVIWLVGIEMCLIDDLNFHNLIWRLALLH